MPGLGAVLAALGVGVAVAQVLPRDSGLAPGLKLAERTFLGAAVALLGLQVDAGALVDVGGEGLAVVLGVVVVTLGAGVLLGRRWGLSPACATLLALGQGVCGTAAVAAAAPAVRADDVDVGVAIGTINALATVGLVAVPSLAALAGLSPEATALLLGATLQSVGHVVAAGMAFDPDVGALALVVKMGRVATLPVVVLGLGLAHREGGSWRRALPPELVAFGLAAAAGSLGLVPASVVAWADTLTDLLLPVAMAAVGTSLRASTLRQQGLPAIGVGAVLFAAQVLVVGGWLLLGGAQP